ncbi:hypothetical protein GC173_05615 [bacterium]|nr:hypothetical protein [bacterium]
MSFKSLFLPVGLILAIIVGVTVPQAGAWIGGLSVADWRVKDVSLCLVFLVTGMGLSLRDFHPSGPLVRAMIACLFINLVLGPLIGVAAVSALPLGRGTAVGLLTILCVPTTLSSAIVIVRNVQANATWSLLMTLALTLLGTMLLPFSLSLTVGAAGGVNLDMGALLISLGTLVGIPLIIGMAIRSRTGALKSKILDYTPSGCIITVVYLTVCSNVEAIRSLTPLALLADVALAFSGHGILLVIGSVAGKMLRLRWADRLALAITCSQKTLPLALTALVAMEASISGPGELGLAVIICVIFHLQQILFDSAIAGWLKKRWQAAETQS